jgi:hypothetical protein
MNPNQIDKLVMLESSAEAGHRAVKSVRDALATIRDKRLYKATHETFEAYLREKWPTAHDILSQLIDGSAPSEGGGMR